jgi:hypothetical protein
MQGGKRSGSGRKKNPIHLKRELVTLRLPNWMIVQLKDEGQIGCVVEYQLLKADFIKRPKDYQP